MVQGRITDSITGEPVKKANLQLRMRAPYPNAPVYLGTSEADGTYNFENVASGFYNLAVSKTGYANSGYQASLANPIRQSQRALRRRDKARSNRSTAKWICGSDDPYRSSV